MDKLNDHGSQYLSFFSKQHNVINHKINKSTENPSNGNMEIENEIKKLNELYAYIGECLDERKHDVLGCSDKLKCYLQDLYRLYSLLNDYDLKLNKIFTYSTNDMNEVNCLNGFPMSRTILTHN